MREQPLTRLHITRAVRALPVLLALTGGSAPAVPLHPAAIQHAKATDFAAAYAAGLESPAARSQRLPQDALILLVDFADEPHAGNLTQDVIEAAFLGGDGSVRDFYARSSYGRFLLTGFTSRWLRLPEPLAFYADGRRGVGGTYPRNARRMVEDAVRAADPFVDFSRFDNDGPDGIPASGDDDGEVDALIVVHAGDGAEFGDRDDILSHAWFTEHPVPTGDGPFVWTYATVSETSPIGVRAHEFGHLLGLADLYDRNSVSVRAAGGLGDWSLMASGVWLGDGRTPADLDAASKIELGFVDPIVPAVNENALALRVARDGNPPDVYQLWTHGRIASEYFIVENRRREGLDLALPAAGGMLVYHVNLLRTNNDDPNDLRVQLLQADGLTQIEGFQSNGDEGDPFPGSKGVVQIGATGTPNTRARDGRETQLVISRISLPTANMTFDLQIESKPLLRLARHSVRELQGDADGIPEAGEQLALDVTIENLGLASNSITLQWRAEPAEDASWDVDRQTLPPLAKLQTTSAQFVLRAASTLGDPGSIVLRAAASGSEGFEQELELSLGLGEANDFLACLEPERSRFTRDCADPAAPWQVENLRVAGAWSLEASPGDLGRIYRSAEAAQYANGADVALVSPPFNLQSESVLQLLHAYEIEDLDAGWSFDGGRVEISLAGGAWELLVPDGGYPRRLYPESVPYLAAAPVFAGTSARRWDLFDLGQRSGSARLRFRFISNASITARGWEIARVEVQNDRLPGNAGPLLSLIAEPNPVAFPTRVAFRIETERTEAARATRLRLFDIRGRLVRTLAHAAVPAQSARFLWDGTDHEGKRVPSGLYLARLEWGGQAAVAKLLVLR